MSYELMRISQVSCGMPYIGEAVMDVSIRLFSFVIDIKLLGELVENY